MAFTLMTSFQQRGRCKLFVICVSFFLTFWKDLLSQECLGLRFSDPWLSAAHHVEGKWTVCLPPAYGWGGVCITANWNKMTATPSCTEETSYTGKLQFLRLFFFFFFELYLVIGFFHALPVVKKRWSIFLLSSYLFLLPRICLEPRRGCSLK